jgi:D-alanyl-D-alanine carboxypeptidase/D-alanyl-D-alanine-endopeptidase (penicillin-binding protein 4)
VARIAEVMMVASDNEAAEVLLRQAALASGRQGSFADGVATVRDVLRANGVDTSGLSLHDGSGLSRRNRIAPITLAQVIAKAVATPRTAGLVADLPVAHFSGTMDERFETEDDGRGVVRAKTGTLTEVHSIAGVVTDQLGTPIVFAAMVDRAKDIPTADAEDALDAVAAALARCVCSARTVGS